MGTYASVASTDEAGGNGGGNGDPTKTAVKNAVEAQAPRLDVSSRLAQLERADSPYAHFQEDAPPCGRCGAIMVRNGSCYVCHSCGSTSGCS